MLFPPSGYIFPPCIQSPEKSLGKRLTARPRGPHGRERTTPRLILKHIESISLGVVRSLPWGPRGLAVRRLPRMQEVVGSNPTEGKICFSQFTVMSKNCCSTVDSNQWRRGSESGAISLSSAARHIDFHSSHRIYVVLVAHSIALLLHYSIW